MSRVYSLYASQEDERPELELSTFVGDWVALLSNSSPLGLTTTKPDSNFEFYSLAGTLGVASISLASRLVQWAGFGLRGRPVTLNQEPFQILVVAEPLDALDLAQSDFSVFRSNPQRVKQFHKFVFKPEAIAETPQVFSIPQAPVTLLANSAAADVLGQSNHAGLDLALVWNSEAQTPAPDSS